VEYENRVVWLGVLPSAPVPFSLMAATLKLYEVPAVKLVAV